MDTQTLHTVTIAVLLVFQGITSIALYATRRGLVQLRDAVPTDTGKRLDKVEGDVVTAHTLADGASKDVAAVKASMRSSSQAARQLAVELERGLR